MIKLPTIPTSSKKSFQSFAGWFIGGDKSPGGQITNVWNSVFFRMYFKANGKLIQIPINPVSIKYRIRNNIDEFNTLSLGNCIRGKNRKLKEISFECLFMRDYSDPLNNSGVVLPPSVYISFFEDLLKNQTVFTFTANSVDMIISQFLPETFNAVLEEFSYEERGGQPGDYYVQITVREYKSIKLTAIEELKEEVEEQVEQIEEAVEEKVEDTKERFVEEVKKKLSGKLRVYNAGTEQFGIIQNFLLSGQYNQSSFANIVIKKDTKLVNRVQLNKKTPDGISWIVTILDPTDMPGSYLLQILEYPLSKNKQIGSKFPY